MGDESSSSTATNEPWEQQVPYLIGGSVGGYTYNEPIYGMNKDGEQTDEIVGYNPVTVGGTYNPGLFPEAARLYQNGGLAPDYYSGQTIAPQSDYTQQAQQMQANRAIGGSPVINAATDSMANIMNGNALAGNQGLNVLNDMSTSNAQNPYLDAMYKQANDATQASLNAQFSSGGRYGSGAHEAAAADASNQLATQIYGNAYNNDATRRLQAAQSAASTYNTGIGQQVVGASTAQSLGNQAYQDAAALSEVGAAQDDYAQQLINADINRYNYTAQQPLIALQNYNALINGGYGGTSTTTMDNGSNTAGTALGGALSGAAAGGSMFGPWGAAGGAVVGGLLGLL